MAFKTHICMLKHTFGFKFKTHICILKCVFWNPNVHFENQICALLQKQMCFSKHKCVFHAKTTCGFGGMDLTICVSHVAFAEKHICVLLFKVKPNVCFKIHIYILKNIYAFNPKNQICVLKFIFTFWKTNMYLA